MPEHMRERIAKNAEFATEKLQQDFDLKSSCEIPTTTAEVDLKTNCDTDNKATDRQQDQSSAEQPGPASSSLGEPIRSVSNNLHVLGVAHTIPHEDYLVCAFTAKVLLFPEVIQPFGWRCHRIQQ